MRVVIVGAGIGGVSVRAASAAAEGHETLAGSIGRR